MCVCFDSKHDSHIICYLNEIYSVIIKTKRKLCTNRIFNFIWGFSEKAMCLDSGLRPMDTTVIECVLFKCHGPSGSYHLNRPGPSE